MINSLPKSLIEAATKHLTHIDVDGELKHRYNSEGKLIHHTEDGIRNFHRGFKDSTVVDEQGRPTVVYHGTGEDFSSFNTDGGTTKSKGAGSFFSSSKHVANTYANGDIPNVRPVYLNLKNPVRVNANGNNWKFLDKDTEIHLPEAEVPDHDEALLASLEDRPADKSATKTLRARKTTLGELFGHNLGNNTMSTDQLARWAKKTGYEGMSFKSVQDVGPSGRFNSEEAMEPHDVHVVFHPSQVKSAIGNSGKFNMDNHDINESADEELRFKTDNPGGDWLKYKQEDAESMMSKYKNTDNSLGKGFSGSVTGYFTKHVVIPVSHIKNTPGAMGEENYVNTPSNKKMDTLKSEIGSPDKFDSKSHPIFIAVNHKGDAYTMEGNHRLAYAAQHGIDHIHAEVRYFNGGETVQGKYHPSTLLKLHHEGQQ